MEALLTSCDAADLAPTLDDLCVSSVEEVAACEVEDLVSDLGIDKDKAQRIVDKAKELQAFEKHKKIIEDSWKAVEDSLSVEATKLFYKRLFEQYPSVVPLFSTTDMDAQAGKLYRTIGAAVKYLEDAEGLIPVLEELGARHAEEWGCEREHYDAVGECLLWTLKTGLEDAWSDDVADAWAWLYGIVSTTMADAGDKVYFERRKKLVEDSWQTVEDSLSVEATKLFYKRLFEEYPSVIPLFSTTDMDAQAGKLYRTIGAAVKYFEDAEGLIPVLEELGARHAEEWGCEREHYDAVGECLLWTLKTGLGDAWSDEVADAWAWLYGIVSTTMADAGDKAQFERRKRKAVEDNISAEAKEPNNKVECSSVVPPPPCSNAGIDATKVVEDSPSVDTTKTFSVHFSNDDIDAITALDTRTEARTFEGGCRFLLNWYKYHST